MSEQFSQDVFHQLLCRFQEAFDMHDWALLKSCLAERIYIDYSSFRGTAPNWISRDDYVALRVKALSHLRMQHNFSNLVVTAKGTKAKGRCNYAIYRFSSDDFFHSFGHYIFDFVKEKNEWKISGINQQLLSNQGNPALHSGAKKVGQFSEPIKGGAMIKKVGTTIINAKHKATCHCGAVELLLDLPDGIVNPRRCNCSMCRRRGAIVASVPLAGLSVVKGQEVLTLYQFNTKVAKHYFCSVCGIYTHHQRRSNPNEFGYNVGCLEGVNPYDIPDVPIIDGIHHPADRRC